MKIFIFLIVIFQLCFANKSYNDILLNQKKALDKFIKKQTSKNTHKIINQKIERNLKLKKSENDFINLIGNLFSNQNQDYDSSEQITDLDEENVVKTIKKKKNSKQNIPQKLDKIIDLLEVQHDEMKEIFKDKFYNNSESQINNIIKTIEQEDLIGINFTTCQQFFNQSASFIEHIKKVDNLFLNLPLSLQQDIHFGSKFAFALKCIDELHGQSLPVNIMTQPMIQPDLHSQIITPIEHPLLQEQHDIIPIEHPLLQEQHDIIPIDHPLLQEQHNIIPIDHPLLQEQHNIIPVDHPLLQEQHDLIPVDHPLLQEQHSLINPMNHPLQQKQHDFIPIDQHPLLQEQHDIMNPMNHPITQEQHDIMNPINHPLLQEQHDEHLKPQNQNNIQDDLLLNMMSQLKDEELNSKKPNQISPLIQELPNEQIIDHGNNDGGQLLKEQEEILNGKNNEILPNDQALLEHFEKSDQIPVQKQNKKSPLIQELPNEKIIDHDFNDGGQLLQEQEELLKEKNNEFLPNEQTLEQFQKNDQLPNEQPQLKIDPNVKVTEIPLDNLLKPQENKENGEIIPKIQNNINDNKEPHENDLEKQVVQDLINQNPKMIEDFSKQQPNNLPIQQPENLSNDLLKQQPENLSDDLLKQQPENLSDDLLNQQPNLLEQKNIPQTNEMQPDELIIDNENSLNKQQKDSPQDNLKNQQPIIDNPIDQKPNPLINNLENKQQILPKQNDPITIVIQETPENDCQGKNCDKETNKDIEEILSGVNKKSII